MLVRKKNGTLQEFDSDKIASAAMKAFLNVGYEQGEAEASGAKVADEVARQLRLRSEVHREEIHDLVQLALMDTNKHAAVAYIVHRTNQRNKHGHVDTLISALRSISVETSRDNANIGNSPSSKMYQIGSEANKHYVLNHVLPKEIAQGHIDGDFHIHDLDYYQLTYNCLVYNLGHLLTTGFYMPHGFIRPPKTIMSAAALTAVTLQSVQNDQYGGVAINDIDQHLEKFIEDATDKEIEQAMESMLFNLNSLHSRAGNQVPFSSISLGRGTSANARRITRAILKMYDAGLGKHEQALFPNIIFKVDDTVNLNHGTPNHDLLLMALDVTSRRMNPTYVFSDSSFNKEYKGNAMAMGWSTAHVKLLELLES